jgi:tRNA-modifying protein YgfZ
MTSVYIDSGVDQGALWHRGDPGKEQRALEEGRAYVDLSHRPVIAVSGSARLTWLHSLTTQHLEALKPGVWIEALILDPQGRVEHQMFIVDDGETTWMHTEPGMTDPLIAYLESMKFMLDVSVRDASSEMCVLRAPGAADLLGGPFALVPRTEKNETIAVFTAGGAVEAGMWAYEAQRIALGLPRLGFENDHKSIPHELGWISTAVHMKKGCYRGQETVAKVHNLGKPPRRLVMLHLDGSQIDLPTKGDPISLDGKVIGYVGTVSRHYEWGPIALGVIKRTVPLDAVLDVGGVPATQEVIVPVD